MADTRRPEFVIGVCHEHGPGVSLVLVKDSDFGYLYKCSICHTRALEDEIEALRDHLDRLMAELRRIRDEHAPRRDDDDEAPL